MEYDPLTMPDTFNVQETLYVAFMASPDTRVKGWLGQSGMPLPRELRQWTYTKLKPLASKSPSTTLTVPPGLTSWGVIKECASAGGVEASVT